MVLYAAPSGRPETSRAYAEAALRPRGFINTTSDAVARDRHWLDRFVTAGLPLLGDDLASQFGTSVAHDALLELPEERGFTLTSSYQMTGRRRGFRNLVKHSNMKPQSKRNALAADGAPGGPSAGSPARVPASPEVAQGGAHQHRGAGLGRDISDPGDCSRFVVVSIDVAWTHGAAHMWDRRKVTAAEASEAVTDIDAVWVDPDPHSKSGRSVRVIGYSHSRQAVLTVILVHWDEGGYWGANG